MAAFLAAAVIGLDPQQIAQAIYSFKGVAHRLEFVTERDGVLFINDSKKGLIRLVLFRPFMPMISPWSCFLGWP